MFYFSGTGNSKYIAELFTKKASAQCYSIEESLDFNSLIASQKVIGFCYPIYSSRIPRIMREFILNNQNILKDKEIIIFCTQDLFSGDGARAFLDLLPKKHVKVIYAEHFLMPNNITNAWFYPTNNQRKIQKRKELANKKIDIIYYNISKGIIKKRGFNPFSKLLGFPQALFFPFVERIGRKGISIDDDCNLCGKCLKICPMNNFDFKEKIIPGDNCTLCVRCVNECPKKAITLIFRKKIKKQYFLK